MNHVLDRILLFLVFLSLLLDASVNFFGVFPESTLLPAEMPNPAAVWICATPL